MINPLKVASAGYLKRTTKAVLIIAIAGYLNFGTTPPTPPTPPAPIASSLPRAGGMTIIDASLQREDVRKKILKDDEELLYFIVKCLQKIAT